MIMWNNYAAIVLAGGKSSRMGRDKSQIVFEGETLTERQIRKCKSLGINEILVSGYGEGMIPDEKPGQGPLGGLVTCLKRTEKKHCLVLPVDVPFLSLNTLCLLARYHADQKEAITILQHADKKEYLIGIYDTCIYPLIQEQLGQGQRAVRKLLEKCDYNTLIIDEETEECLNCNDPETMQTMTENRKC